MGYPEAQVHGACASGVSGVVPRWFPGWFDDGVPDHGYADVARDGDWTLRSALVRFAQPEPVRAGVVLELVRRTDGALKRAGEAGAEELAPVVAELEAIAEALVAWAIAHDGPPPVDVVEHHGARAHAKLEELGVPRQEAPPRPPSGARRRG